MAAGMGTVPKKGVLRNSTSALPTSSSCGSLAEAGNKPVKRLRFALEDEVCYYCDNHRKELTHPSNKLFLRWTVVVGLVLLFVFLTFPNTPLDNPHTPFHIHRIRAVASTHFAEGVTSSFSGVALWAHPHVANKSLVISVVDEVGLTVFDTSGKRVTSLKFDSILPGSINVDYDLPISDNDIRDVILTANQHTSTLVFFEITGEGVINRLSETRALLRGTKMTAVCSYRNAITNEFFAFAFGEERGRMEQWSIRFERDSKGSRIMARTQLVRSIEVGSEVTSCVADSERGVVYVYEQQVGIWRYGALPSAGNTRSVVDTKNTTSFGPRRLKHSRDSIGGMAIYRAKLGRGYLLVTNPGEAQGASVLIYGRGPENRFLNRFQVISSKEGDEVLVADSNSIHRQKWLDMAVPDSYEVINLGRGIGVLNLNLGKRPFQKGVLALQNVHSFKRRDTLELVPWNVLAGTIGCRSDARKHLIIDSEYDLRNPYTKLHPTKKVAKRTPSSMELSEEDHRPSLSNPQEIVIDHHKAKTADEEARPKQPSSKDAKSRSPKPEPRKAKSLIKKTVARNDNIIQDTDTGAAIPNNNRKQLASSAKKETTNTNTGETSNNSGLKKKAGSPSSTSSTTSSSHDVDNDNDNDNAQPRLHAQKANDVDNNNAKRNMKRKADEESWQ